MTRKTAHNQGFSLIEVIVTLAVLGLSLAAALTAISGGLRSANLTQDRAHMTILAENILTRAVTERALLPGQNTGRGPGPYLWQVDIVPQEQDRWTDGRIDPVPEPAEFILFLIRVEIRAEAAPDAPPLILETFKTANFAEEDEDIVERDQDDDDEEDADDE